MKKYKAGYVYMYVVNRFDYYTGDFEKFYTENDEELSQKDLEDWAMWINSPWSQTHERYEIRLNCKDAYTEMDESDPAWRCEYSVTGYDGISASVFGYGNTEIAALEDCKNHFKMLQDRYNAEGVSF